ncbi:thiosulfate/3-mercaptopyruvate sulfurtransferase [Frankia sp. EI5c]|uniref:sulfurtransferase n=1 Tax=Frankia sp. EI5c TaxID=683316 RepID=UPI0007C3C3F0|nr:rhodanese-like domain-containing protein [Frankia sp. EI5c]OAA25374.1 thiosulfate/3-mercaptopyruvate sulfurtransferase [Frankia sp. EI5c]
MAEPTGTEAFGPTVTVGWLAAHLGEDGLVILDATLFLGDRTETELFPVRPGLPAWRRARIPGSRHVALESDLSDPAASYHFSVADDARLAAALTAAGVTDGARIVCYDAAGGMWAARLWWTLRDLGLPVAVLIGGFEAWTAAGAPVATGDPGRPEEPAGSAGSAGPPPRLRPGRSGWVGRAEVIEIMHGERPGTLVCALGADQFAGRGPTRYDRPGHIPGSRNVPAGSPAELAEAVLGPDRDQPLVLYCGAGISASALALDLVTAGYRDLRIYDGSLEDWTSSPELPLATGDAP